MAPTRPTRLASLLRKIHPPLTLSPRESQQLAQTLSRSFQDQLDKEHPKTKTRTGNHSDIHISSILHNPHFSLSRFASPIDSSRPRSRSTGSLPSAIEQLQTFVLDRSLFSFRQQIAAGEASLESAKECLRLYRGNRTNASSTLSSVPAAFIGPEQDQVGLTIVNWLWSTGLEESMEFVYDSDFMALLVPRLCGEGQSERVERWIERMKITMRDSTATEMHNGKLAESASFIFKSLIFSVEKARGLNEALNLFCKTLRKVPLSPEAERTVYGPAARCLSQILTTFPAKKVDIALYEDFAIDLPRCLGGTHLKQKLAWMNLKHPLQPDPNLALEFLRLRCVSTSQDLSKTRKIAAIRSHIEVAEVLLASQRINEAHEVMQILADSFPLDLKTSRIYRNSKTSAIDVVNAIRFWSKSSAVT